MSQPSPRDPIHRPHSNTVSGERPLPPIVTSYHITPARRSSEGNPQPPFSSSRPLSPPSPDPEESSKTLSLHRHFPDMIALSTSSENTDDEVPQHNNRNRSSTTTSASSASLLFPAHAPSAAHESTSTVARLFNKKAMTRSRESSLSTQNGGGNETEQQHTTTAAKLLSAAAAAAASAASSAVPSAGPTKLRSSEVADDSGSDDLDVSLTTSSSSTTSDTDEAGAVPPAPPAGSIASACNIELANAKRNQDFHQLFRSVPEEDPLLEDFGCALQKEILLQGRIYISENHLCFNANIFGWVTNLVIAFVDIVDIEKRMTALFIPNAIQVSTLQAKHFFASFLSRDQAYDLIVDVWRQSRPQKSEISNEANDTAEDNQETSSVDESDSSSGSCTFTDIGDDSSDLSANGEVINEPPPFIPSDASKDNTNGNTSRRATVSDGSRPRQNSSTGGTAAVEDDTNAKSTTTQTREKSECECLKNGTHFPKIVLDQSYQCTIEKLYNLLYQGDFMKRFLAVEKNTNITVTPWRKGDGNIEFVRELSYIKPLNGAIGPKQTKCLLKEEICHKDFDDYVTQLTTTQTPDVPSGNSFNIKTRTCLMWAGQGQVRMIVSVLVDFTKSSWIKSTIENASISGQESYYKALDAALRRSLLKDNQEPSSDGHNKGAKRKKRGKKKKNRDPAKQDGQEPLKGGALVKIRTAISSSVGWLTEYVPMPSTSQTSALCMLVLVFINFYMASKMSQVDVELKSLRNDVNNQKQLKAPQAFKLSHPRQPLPNHPEIEEDLWSWLEKLDPEKEPRTATVNEPRIRFGVKEGEQSQEGDDAWSIHLKESHLAKDAIDEHMADLETMIQRAETNMDRVNDVVNQQRRRILDSWQKKAS